jgi:MSHA pilin protein MshC
MRSAIDTRRATGDRRLAVRRAGGFTLPELVLVLVLVGLLAAFAVPRLNVQGFEQRIFADEVANALRYARRVAIQSGCEVTVSARAGADDVVVAYTGRGGSPCSAGTLEHPARGGPFVLGGEVASNATVAFNARGRSAGATILLGGAETIAVEPGTGYVHR